MKPETKQRIGRRVRLIQSAIIKFNWYGLFIDILVLAGIGIIAAGAWTISVSAGLITLGALLLALAVVLGFAGRGGVK